MHMSLGLEMRDINTRHREFGQDARPQSSARQTRRGDAHFARSRMIREFCSKASKTCVLDVIVVLSLMTPRPADNVVFVVTKPLVGVSQPSLYLAIMS